MKPYKLISEQMQLRGYRVRAYLNPKTGRVFRVVAGCRCWKSLTEACAHYAGGSIGKTGSLRWRDNKWRPNADAHPEPSNGYVRQRNDALLTVARVAARVLRYQRKCSQ